MVKTHSITELRTTLEKERAQEDSRGRKKSWAKIAQRYSVNPGLLWRIVHQGYEPRRADIRKLLGLPEVIEQSVARDEHGRFVPLEDQE